MLSMLLAFFACMPTGGFPFKLLLSHPFPSLSTLGSYLIHPNPPFPLCPLLLRRVHHIGSTVRSNPPLLTKLNFFLLSSPMPWNKFPRHGNDQCDSQNKPRQGSTWEGYEPRNDAGHSLPETENLAFLSSSTLTGRSSMRSVSLFRSVL